MVGSGMNGFGFDMGALLGNMMGQNNGGFGNGGDGWWALIIILALCGGFGDGNGILGNRNGGTSSTTAVIDASLQRGFDNQTVINKLNGIENGICSLGYDQLNQMNNLGQTVTSTGWQIQNAIQNQSIAQMQQAFNAQTQLQNCCCNIENLLQQANYNRQADTCAITTAINQMGQAIIQNDNANYRQLHDEQIAIQMQAKDDRIAQLTAALNRCDNRADNAAQTAEILANLNPTPRPAYLVQNPNGCITSFNAGYALANANNGGCGNGCNNNWGVGFVA